LIGVVLGTAFVVDLPFSALGDTCILPVTVPVALLQAEGYLQ
jgi:uncharacterized protein YceK